MEKASMGSFLFLQLKETRTVNALMEKGRHMFCNVLNPGS